MGLDFEIEQGFAGPVAGVDEAGRGPWAGPVVAAAVILDPGRLPSGLDDSKKLRPSVRERLFDEISERARVGVGQADVVEIDRDNILQATFSAMRRAVRALGAEPAAVLVDGNHAPRFGSRAPIPAHTFVRGDGRVLAIAAASIIAKVTRDRIMSDLAEAFPGYGWERNKGYGTKEHRAALETLGVSPHHRRSFAPIHKIWTQDFA